MVMVCIGRTFQRPRLETVPVVLLGLHFHIVSAAVIKSTTTDYGLSRSPERSIKTHPGSAVLRIDERFPPWNSRCTLYILKFLRKLYELVVFSFLPPTAAGSSAARWLWCQAVKGGATAWTPQSSLSVFASRPLVLVLNIELICQVSYNCSSNVQNLHQCKFLHSNATKNEKAPPSGPLQHCSHCISKSN